MKALRFILLTALVLFTADIAFPQAAFLKNAEITKVTDHYKVNAQNNAVSLSRDMEVITTIGDERDSSVTTRAFTLPAYGDSVVFYWNGVCTSDTGTANWTVILRGSAGNGVGDVYVDTVINKVTTEAAVNGHFTITGTIWPYYRLSFVRLTNSPKDAKFTFTSWSVAYKH